MQTYRVTVTGMDGEYAGSFEVEAESLGEAEVLAGREVDEGYQSGCSVGSVDEA